MPVLSCVIDRHSVRLPYPHASITVLLFCPLLCLYFPVYLLLVRRAFYHTDDPSQSLLVQPPPTNVPSNFGELLASAGFAVPFIHSSLFTPKTLQTFLDDLCLSVAPALPYNCLPLAVGSQLCVPDPWSNELPLTKFPSACVVL